jgi:flavodoxin
MPFIVVYFSRGGKTRKVATAIAQELGCEAVDVTKGKPDLSGVDLLVVGSGTYGGMPGPSILEFLKGVPQATGGKAAVFVTSAGPGPKSLPRIKDALEEKGYAVISSFDCRGQFTFTNRGHPDEKDLESARAFASDLKK